MLLKNPVTRLFSCAVVVHRQLLTLLRLKAKNRVTRDKGYHSLAAKLCIPYNCMFPIKHNFQYIFSISFLVFIFTYFLHNKAISLSF